MPDRGIAQRGSELMETARQFWRPIINDFNPVGAVRPEDVAKFFVDRYASDPTRSLVQRLQVNLQNSLGQLNPYKALLTGHVGSGKSSELIRLGQELVADFFVVWFDAEMSLATEKVNHFDVLLGMGLAVHAAAEAAGLRPDKRLARNLVNSLARLVRKYEEREGFALRLDQLLDQVFAIALVAGAVGGAPVALLVGTAVIGAGIHQVLKATRIELNVRDDLVRILELPANRVNVIGALNAIIEDVQEKAQKPMFLITDGLDKVPASRARLLFAESALLTEPACALVYTAPVEFYHRLIAGHVTNLFHDYKMLPNPPVHKRLLIGEHWQMAREPNPDGLQIMRQVVAKRLGTRGQSVDDVITPEALEVLARASGGVMRELVRHVRDAATFAQLRGTMRIDETLVQSVVEQQRQEIAPRLTIDHRDAIRRVLRQGALSGGQHEGVEDELLRSLYLLSYEDNRFFWFDTHPNVLPLL